MIARSDRDGRLGTYFPLLSMVLVCGFGTVRSVRWSGLGNWHGRVADILFACNELLSWEVLGMEELATWEEEMNMAVVRMRHDACACVRFLRRCLFFFLFFVLSCVLFFCLNFNVCFMF